MSDADDVLLHHYDTEIDIHYSPDDFGWYAQDYRTENNRGTTQIFVTLDAAIDALDRDQVHWTV